MSKIQQQSHSAKHPASMSTTLNSAFQTCTDTSDAVELFMPQQLYLKPVAKLNISVQLPQLKLPGKTISNWEVMEKLKSMVKPVQFTVLKVSKSTLEFIRFEGEIENKSNLNEVVAGLDGRTIKLSGFSELLKIRSAEAKTAFPTRHTWDSYFRDAKNMNEMKPGERPDTIHLSNLPSRWFSSRQENGRSSDKPSEYVFRKVFEQFGEVRCVDIPMLDPYRSQMKAHISGLKTFSFGQELAFEGYVQYKEYVCFVKAMDALRGMKILHKEGDKGFTASIKIDFDRTKHLSDASIRKRRLERERLMAKEREQEELERHAAEEAEKEAESVRKKEEEEQQIKDQVAEERRQRKAERQQTRQLRRLKREEAQRMNYKIAVEERKLLIAQRKLESIRLLDELFERVKAMRLDELKKESNTATDVNPEAEGKEDMEKKERELRSKLMKKYKGMQELQLKGQQEKLRQTVESRSRVHSVLVSSKRSKTDDNSEYEESSSGSSSSASVSSVDEAERKEKAPEEKKESKKNAVDPTNNWLNPLGVPTTPGVFPMDFHVGLMGFNPGFGGRFPYPQGDMFPGRGRWPRWPRHSRSRSGSGYMMPDYYYGMSDDYYKYFSKLAGQRGSSRSRSRSRSGSRSRARRYRHTRSNSRSSRSRRSRSKSRTSKSNVRSRSRNRVKRSRSRSKSSPTLKARVRSRSRSRSQSRRTDYTSKPAGSKISPHLSHLKSSVSNKSLTSGSKDDKGKSSSTSSQRSKIESNQEAKSQSRKRSSSEKGRDSTVTSLSTSIVLAEHKLNSENGEKCVKDAKLDKTKLLVSQSGKKKKHKHKKDK